VKQLMGLHEKCSFIEIRLQNLVGDGGDTQRWLYQSLAEAVGASQKIADCMSVCRQWCASRLRFKDLKPSEWEPQFMKIWALGSASALKQASDWASKSLNGMSATDLAEAQAEVMIIRSVIKDISFTTILNQME
jgi:hypothetical protein